MRRRPLVPLLLTPALAAGLVALAPPGAAAPPEDRGRERSPVAADAASSAPAARAGGKRDGVGPSVDRGYPRQTRLVEPPRDPADRSRRLGLIAYDEIAPRLNALQASSDRVSVEVIGTSTQGRELYLVTVTAPESQGQAKQQEAMRRLIEEDPARAARDPRLLSRYKAPFLVHGNIHGDEWEGTDGILRVVEELASATDAETTALLERTRVYAVLSVNPDGRVNGTRANAAGFDMNRDYITASQPEVVATRQVLIDAQPLVFVDLHGYVGGTLLEPATAPHGRNYEYDLYIKHALPNALGMERELEATPVPGARPTDVDPVIPFRDFPAGEWDDWPPIFTPMYSMYHGAVGHTVEFPLRVNRSSYSSLQEEELRRRAQVNTEVAARTVRASLAYVDEHRAELVADQVELFRRGAAGEQRSDLPVDFVDGWGSDDQGYVAQFPRAYVIPAGGDAQRSPAAAARLVDHLVANDVRVTRADRPFTAGGREFPAGSYVVDMHQPKRGLANTMLEAGQDISDRVPQMYDISGWSHRLLWGASVDVLESGALTYRGSAVTAAAPTGALPSGSGDLALDLQDGADARAVNALLAEGVALTWRDGTVVVPASDRAAAARAAERYGVRFTAARGTGGQPLNAVTVAVAGGADDLKVLRDLGFDVRPVSTAVLNAGFDWTGVDVLYAGSGLSYGSLTPAARTALDGFLADGGLVGRGATGAALNAATGSLPVTATTGRGAANGVVAVTGNGGPVTGGALPHAFVYGPTWFTGLGSGVSADQRYGDLVAGHWLSTAGGQGPEQARGAASVVRGLDADGTSVVLFGTQPAFRDHPKGLFSQLARAVLHTAATAQ